MKQVTALYLLGLPVFEGVPLEIVNRIYKVGLQFIFRNGSHLYYPSDIADSLFLLIEGNVRIGIISEDGFEVLRTVVQPGEFFGEYCLVNESNRDEYAIGHRGSGIYMGFNASEVKAIMLDSPELTMRFFSLIGQRARVAERRVESYVFKDSKTRLVEFILNGVGDIATEEGHKNIVYTHMLSHRDIANLTDTSRQFATTAMNELKREGLIDFNRTSIIVKNLVALKEKHANASVPHV